MSEMEHTRELAEMTIAKDRLRGWIDSFSGDYLLIAPVVEADGPPTYKEVSPGSEILLDNSRWSQSPKEHVAPRYETLFVLEGPPGQEQITSGVPEPEPTILIGLKPCDLRSLEVLDRVYLDGRFKDPYYAAKREKMLTVAVVCDSKRWSCFCHKVGDPIEWLAGADVVLTDVGDEYMLTAFSTEGAAMLEGRNLPKATPEQTEKRDVVWNALAFGAEEPAPSEEVAKAVDWNEPVWDEVAEKCVGCGVCSFLCPTCTCFDIQDEELPGGKVERFRVRDTCQFCDFTKMGHGHNPRPGKKERVRQRISHKFKYIVQQCNVCGCVGCGRCLELCPAGTDLRAVLTEVMQGDRTESVSA